MKLLNRKIEYNDNTYTKIINNIDAVSVHSITGLAECEKTLFVSSLFNQSKNSIILVCPSTSKATRLIQDLKFFTDSNVLYFPSKEIVYYDIDKESREIDYQRIHCIKEILKGSKNIIVTTVDVLMSSMLPIEKYNKEDIILKNGESISLSILNARLLDNGYTRTQMVEGSGQYAMRGGILDVCVPGNENGFRIEFFGNEIDSIRTFDVLTQRSIDTLKQIQISSFAEISVLENERKCIVSNLNDVILQGEISEELKENLQIDIEKIENGSLDNIVDKYIGAFDTKLSNFLEYVKDYTTIYSEPTKCLERAENLMYENEQTIKVLESRNQLYTPYINRYTPFLDILKSNSNMSRKTATILLEDSSIKSEVLSMYSNNKKITSTCVNSKEYTYYKNMQDVLVEDILKEIKVEARVDKASDLNGVTIPKTVLLVFSTDAKVEFVKNLLQDRNINATHLVGGAEFDVSFKPGHVYITKGILTGGFKSELFNLFLIAENISGVYTAKTKFKKSTIGHSIDNYEDLKEGDFVVHENHGIGIYAGITDISILNVRKDYIKIEYRDKGVLYVPINQLDSVKKFVCDDSTTPVLNSLGSKEWERNKQKASKYVKEMAKELVALYAKREKARGFAFSKDSPFQREFEDTFEYELTNDQKRSMEEIKKDMEEEIPMDRLLCGDVGYGKTELALRAAFKAIVDNKQVAYLVPTTVLCLQQYNTFKSRMDSYGVRVEMLSRFKSKKQQTQILKDLVDGKIDIVVGTHRILSKDIFFKDLGLLIIDEEHRFGVKAKEAIKSLRESIDVLSMSATPIPRTLHMSMVGIRQMSTLNEPPMERIPVHTYVLEYDENIIKDAIEKELLRDGQVFYINNRVENIEEIANKVRGLVPSANIAFAHGRMSPVEIEKIMTDFTQKKIDVLICTTILESGIDIQNANTLIVENADRLGLAQLYQIRGRVGRSSRLAYAYITYKKDKQISELSEKKLKAIRDFTEFGSGFKIALRDLEIRGAGNLLGGEQHGHMAKIGYDLYISLLERAIIEEKASTGTTNKDESTKVLANINEQKEVKIELEISAYIPDDYIKDPIQKIAMYQKISDIGDSNDTLEVVDELLDRFGNIPKEVEYLIGIVEIRNLARSLGVTKIWQSGKVVYLEPGNYKICLTNFKNSDILIRVQLELKNICNYLKEKR